MTTLSARYPALPWLPAWFLAVLLLFASGAALAQSEPSMNQIYEAARAGRLDQAQSMMKQVIAAHPNSAKAHFVQAELLAQQGRIDAARESLATAERLQPGLAFATPEAVKGLRARLSGSGLNGLSGVAPRSSTAGGSSGSGSGVPAPSSPRASPSAPASSGPSFGLFWPVLLIVGGVALFLMFRRRSSAARTAAAGGAGMAPQGYPGGTFTNPAPGAAGSAVGAPYGQPQGQPYGQPPGQPYAQPAQSAQPGMGSRIAGGLATGAAIGAGMMAAQAIGRSMTGNNEHANDRSAGHGNDGSGAAGGGGAPIPAGDLGGDNFGIRDSGGWDDSSSISSGDAGGGGSSEWDS